MDVVVGSRAVEVATANQRVREYVTSDQYLFGVYDTYRSNDDPNVLADGDLLAPVLLNVQVKISSYRKLQQWRPRLEAGLAKLPEVDLRDATDDDIEKVAACFDVLDGEARMGVTLAKVLHRKHPKLMPLFDRNVYACYAPQRVHPAPRRSWTEFMRLLAAEMRADLKAEAWDAICSAANKARGTPPELTPLRALDILAWWPDVPPISAASASR